MASSATISLLPVSLSLVHIPRSHIRDHFHPILRQLLLPSPTFLNVTCNEIELSIFAEHRALQDFEFIAQRDAQLNGPAGRERPFAKEHTKRHPGKAERDAVEVSHERWNVLQIDSHADGLDNSGARVHELSAPLAAAGISILYQSSYMSDFIFVKEYRLAEVMSLLGAAGFDLYQSDPANLTSQVSAFTSPILSPLANAADDTSSIHLLDLSSTSSIFPESGAVLTRSRSSTDASQPALSSPAHQRKLTDPQSPEGDDLPPNTGKPPLSRSHSHSPSSSDVRLLRPDLTCVGLADDSAEIWGLKIVKLIAFPDLISPMAGRSWASTEHRAAPGPTVLSPVAELACSLPLPADLSGASETEVPSSQSESECETVSSKADTACAGDLSDEEDRASSESPIFDINERPSWDEDDEDAADESSEDDSVPDTPPSVAGTPDDNVPIQAGEHQNMPSRPKLPHVDTDKTTRARIRTKRRATRCSPSLDQPPPPPPLVPFFSFTRTPEGSSLTAPVTLLTALFPSSERHMVICCGELDVQDSRAASPHGDEVQPGDDAKEDEDSFILPETQGTLRCLQIDLRKFGLDKHGLVNRYSRVLEDNGINHMYSSTFKTANLLVDKAHAKRAYTLLRSC